MDTFQPMGSQDFFWPLIRDKWLELADFSLYFTLSGPDIGFLKKWKSFWESDACGASPQVKKFFLMKYYLRLRTSPPALLRVQRPIQEVIHREFQKYFKSLDTSSLEKIFQEQIYLLPNIIAAIEDLSHDDYDILKKIEDFFSHYGDKKILSRNTLTGAELSAFKRPFGIPYFLEKLTDFIAQCLIDARIKYATSWTKKKMSPSQRKYLDQGLLTYPKIFESGRLDFKPPSKKHRHTKSIQSTHDKNKPKKIIPSWMIAAYIHGRFDRKSFEWQETLVERERLKKNTYEALCEYVRTSQKSVISHFKRISYSLYLQYLPPQLLETAELAFDTSSHFGLNEFDLELIENFYQKIKDIADFNKKGSKGQHRLSDKIKLYLKYHGLQVILVPGSVFSLVSKAIEGMSCLDLDIDQQHQSFIGSLHRASSTGWVAIKKYGPLVAKIALVGAMLLSNKSQKNENTSLDTESLDEFEELYGGLSITAQDNQKNKEEQQKKTKEISSVDEMLVQHFSRYIYSMIEDYLADENNQSLLPVEKKFPWLESLKTKLKDQWKEYHYRLKFIVPDNDEYQHNLDETEQINCFAKALQCQPQWAALLLRRFKISITDLENAVQKATQTVLIRPVNYQKHQGVEYQITHRIAIDSFAQWRKNAQSCWHELAEQYLADWAQTLTKNQLFLPHLVEGQPFYTEMIELIKQKISDPIKALFQNTFSPQISQYWISNLRLEDASINFERLEYLLAIGLTQKAHDYVSTFEDRYNIQQLQRIFLTALKYDINTINFPGIRDAMRSYGVHDTKFSCTVHLAEQLTTQQFIATFDYMGFETRRISLQEMNNNRVNILLLAWKKLLPLMRDENKLCNLLDPNSPISADALQVLLRYCSDDFLWRFMAGRQLKIPQEKDPGSSINKLVIIAYRYGLIKTAEYLMQQATQEFQTQNNHIRIYAQTLDALSTPKMISTTDGVKDKNSVAEIQSLPLNELRTLLFQSAQAAVGSLAQIILNAPALQAEPLSNTDYYLILRSLRSSQAWDRHKQHYLSIIIQSVSEEKLRQICFECYNRKPCLAQMLLDWHESPRVQRGPSVHTTQTLAADVLMHKILEAILQDTPRKIMGQNNSYPLSWTHASQAIASLNALKKYLLSIDFLNRLITKRWYRSVGFLAPFHGNSVTKEQWLPLYTEKVDFSKWVRQHGRPLCSKWHYYQNFEEYMAHLISKNVFSQDTHEMIKYLYNFWKKNQYSPSLNFCTNILTSTPRKHVMSWLKAFLKLSLLFDNNPARRHELFNNLLKYNEINQVKIHAQPLDKFVQKTSDHALAAAYIEYYSSRLEEKFPAHIDRVVSINTLGSFFYRYYASCSFKKSVFVYGHHIALLQKYLQQQYHGLLQNPSLAVRTDAREKMALLMKSWLSIYGADITAIRVAHKQQKKERKNRHLKYRVSRYDRDDYLYQCNTEELDSLGFLSIEDSMNWQMEKYTDRTANSGGLLKPVLCKRRFKGNPEIHFNPVRDEICSENVLRSGLKTLVFTKNNSEEKESDESIFVSRVRAISF